MRVESLSPGVIRGLEEWLSSLSGLPDGETESGLSVCFTLYFLSLST